MGAAGRGELRQERGDGLETRAVALVAAVTLLRVGLLFVTPAELDLEEAQYWLWSRDPAWGYYSKPPLIAWMIALTTAVGGNTEAVIRLPSPLLHAVTALVLGLLARTLVDPRAGAWVSVLWITLPGVSFSSMLMTTDAPLLLCWSLALLALIQPSSTWRWAVLGGVATGLGLLSKYAMLYFPLGAVVAFARRDVRRPSPGRLAIFAGLPLLFALPNLWWNVGHEAATVRHTMDVASIGRRVGGLGGLAAFVGGQIGLFGPLLLLAIAASARRRDDVRLRSLWPFCVPLLVAMVVLAVVARANANWAVVAYPAGIVLAVSWCLASGREGWLRLSLAGHLLAVVLVPLGFAWPGRLDLPGRSVALADRFAGWRDLGDEVARRLAQDPDSRLLSEDRRLLGRLAYYARVPPERLMKWDLDGRIDDHLELTHRLPAQARGRFLLIEPWVPSAQMLGQFRSASPPEPISISLGAGRTRVHWLSTVTDYQGP